MTPDTLTLEVEKPAAGGRMIARNKGQIVLVAGAIPGERVKARVERTGKGVVFAETVEVLQASPDRRPPRPDWRCGGDVLAHVAYPRQLLLKGEILRDAMARIGHLPMPEAPVVIGSAEQGYRMRARLHAHGRRLGFYREGTHQLCDAAATGHLMSATNEWLAAIERLLGELRLDGIAGLEIAENIPADQRACHLELHGGVDVAPYTRLLDAGPLTGLSVERADRQGVEILAGQPTVVDVIHVKEGDPASALRLHRDVRAFFQGNRFLLERLVRYVVSLVAPGPVVDLYAGVGLFGLSLAAAGFSEVTLVEGDAISGEDLQRNADPLRDRVRVIRASVETFVGGPASDSPATYIVDPPRTGLSKDAVAGIVGHKPGRLVYVSCDAATFARDTRILVDAGYDLGALSGFDLFPNTAHVESVAVFSIG